MYIQCTIWCGYGNAPTPILFGAFEKTLKIYMLAEAQHYNRIAAAPAPTKSSPIMMLTIDIKNIKQTETV
jgi:hypothetical protein